MLRYQVTADGFASRDVDCPGCSGDALTMALHGEPVEQWKVNRRSPDGRDWFFDVTISGASRSFQVHRLND